MFLNCKHLYASLYCSLIERMNTVEKDIKSLTKQLNEIKENYNLV